MKRKWLYKLKKQNIVNKTALRGVTEPMMLAGGKEAK